MTPITRWRKTDPWWDLDGVAARRTRMRQKVMGGAAFLVAEAACGLTLAVWLLRLHTPIPGITG